MTVTAVDPENTFLTYTIKDGNDDGHFLGTFRRHGFEISLLSVPDFEVASRHVLTVEVSDSVNKITTTITVRITNLDEGDATINIAGAAGVDLDNLDVGDVLNASVLTPDPDGIVPNTDMTWRWYHVDAPDVAIGSGTQYVIKSSDRRERIGVEYSYKDPLDAADNTETKVSATLDAIVPPEPFFFRGGKPTRNSCC